MVKPTETRKRFWILGAAAAVLFSQSFAILSHDSFDSLWIFTYGQAILLGLIEALAALVLTVMFLWKTAIWWHDRPRELKHVFDDPHIIS